MRRSAPANFGAPLPSFWDCEGFETDNLDDSPPGCAARQRSRTAQQPQRKTMRNRKMTIPNCLLADCQSSHLIPGLAETAVPEAERPGPSCAYRFAMLARTKDCQLAMAPPGGTRLQILAERRGDVRFGGTNPRCSAVEQVVMASQAKQPRHRNVCRAGATARVPIIHTQCPPRLSDTADFSTARAPRGAPKLARHFNANRRHGAAISTRAMTAFAPDRASSNPHLIWPQRLSRLRCR